MVNIYGIYNLCNGDLLYLGSTERSVNDRSKEHLRNLKMGKHSNKSLQKEYDKVNGKIEVRLISSINTSNSLLRFFYEMLYISAMKPLTNKCVISQGNSRIVLQRTSEEIAEELINVIDELVV